MSGPWHLDYFTLWPRAGRLATLSAGPQDRRFAAALAASCLLHALLLFLPGLGASAVSSGLAERLARAFGPSPMLEVRLLARSEGARPVILPSAEETGGLPAPVARKAPAEASEPARGADLLPLPGTTFYTVDQITKHPVAITQPNLFVARTTARSVQGKVSLKIWVGERGEVEAVEVEKSNLPEAISKLTAEAFERLRYEPGEINGRPVGVVLRIEVDYGRAIVKQ